VRIIGDSAVFNFVIKRDFNRSANKSNHQKWNPSFRHACKLTRDIFRLQLISTILANNIFFQ
jgi:hypothetical protein